jgi:hypothetical protein
MIRLFAELFGHYRTVDGAVQQMLPESITLNGGAVVTGDLLVPGSPTVRINGHPTYAGTLEGSGASEPRSHQVTLNGGASLRSVIRRSDPVAFPSHSAPASPIGTRSVNINSTSGTAGDFTTLRNLTLNGGVGQFSIPAGAYGDFTANGGSGFILGVAGATHPAVYHFQRLNLNGLSQLQILGPVVINLAYGLSANGTVGTSTNPAWLKLNIYSGGLTVNGNCIVFAHVSAPSGTVIVNGDSLLAGGVVSDRLIVNGRGVLRLVAAPDGGGNNQPPVALSQGLSLDEDTIQLVTLAGTDPEGQALTFAVVDAPVHGTLSGVAPSLAYTPNPGFSGSDSFSFTVNDGSLVSAPATISLSVRSINDEPVADAKSATLDEDTSATVVLTGTDAEGAALIFSISDLPVHGTLSLSGATATYVPTPNFFGTDQFSYTVSDGALTSAPATVSLSVRSVNDAPVAAALTLSGVENTPIATRLGGTDLDGDTLTYTVLTQPTHGTLTGTAPNLSYRSESNFSGLDTFTFKANDGQADSAPAIVTLSINNPNDPPAASNDTLSTAEDTTLTLTLRATDPDGDELGYTIATPPAHGTLSGIAPNLIYTPAPDYFGTDSFTFTARDAQFTSSVANVVITVTPVNDAPTANPQTLSTAEETPIELSLSGSDAENDTITYIITMPPAHGTLSGSAPSLTYTPADDYSGSDSFAFKVNDGSALSTAAVVAISVTPLNDAPTAESQSLTTPEDTARALTLTGADRDGDPITFIVTVPPQHGTLSGTAPNLTYTPTADYAGADSFAFIARDLALTDSAPALVTFIVTPVNDAPVPLAQTLSTQRNLPLNLTLSADDADGDALTYAVLIPPAHGTLSGTVPNLTYTPANAYVGPDSFTFAARDSAITSAPAVITLSITSTNRAPVAESRTINTSEDVPATFVLVATDADGDTLTYTVLTAPRYGTLTGTAPLLTYIPAANFFGSDAFTYKVNDGETDSATATLTLGIASVNDVPTVAPATASTTQNTAVTIPLVASDIDGDALAATISSVPAHGTATPVSGGGPLAIRYQPEPGFFGTDDFFVRVNDGRGGLSTSVRVRVTVAPDPRGKTFTTTDDFRSGQLVTLKSDDNELTTGFFPSAYDFVWIAVSGANMVVRLDAETGRVIGEYRSAPEGTATFPSRVAVDSRGNAWVANRGGGSIVKIGLGSDNDTWVDRDADGKVTTAVGQDSLLPWPSAGHPVDETIVLYINTPVSALDHIAVDKDDNVWVGGHSGSWFLYDGRTGALLREEPNPIQSLGGGGGFIDADGVQVSTGGKFLHWDTTKPLTQFTSAFAESVRPNSWGIAKDREGNYWVTKDWTSTVEKISPTGEKLGEFYHGGVWAQGIAIDQDGHIWVAHSHCGYDVGHLLPDGTWVGNVPVTNHGPTEVSVDRKGRIWVVATPGIVSRINPLGGPIGKDGVTPVGEVDVISPYLGGACWTFGTFVGSRTGLALEAGSWRFSYDSQLAGASWGPVLWNALLANDASILVEVALSADGNSFGAWQLLTLESPVPAGTGRYLRGRVTLTPATTSEAPVLHDLSVGTQSYNTPSVSRRWYVSAGADIAGNWPDEIQLKGATWRSAHAFPSQPTYQWSLVSFTPLATGGGTAPVGGSVTFENATDPRSKATFSGVGEYVLRLTATLAGVTSTDDVSVKLIPYNKAPYVTTARNVFLRDAAQTTTLVGTTRDDGLPLGSTLALQWKKLFGPGAVTFGSPTESTTTARFSLPGIYLLQLSGNDSEHEVTTLISVHVGLNCYEPAPAGIVSWWQASGDGADHVSGNQAFLDNGAKFAEGRVGPAFSFDGINDRLSVFSSSSLDVGERGGFGFEAWVRPADSRHAILAQYGRSAASTGISIEQNSGNLRVNLRDTAGRDHLVEIGSVFTPAVWTHVSVNYRQSSGLIELFINGQPRHSQVIGSFKLQTALDLRFGQSWANDKPFKGELDEISFYDRPLNLADVAKISDAAFWGKRPPVSNAAPTVTAGGTYFVLNQTDTVALRGSVTDDAIATPEGVTSNWRLLSGPAGGTATFADPHSPTTTATFSTPGYYYLELYADDGVFCARDIATMVVNLPCDAPAPNGLVAWWTANHTTRDAVSDRLASSLVTTYAEGKVGAAWDFADPRSYVLVPGRPELNLGESAAGFTIEFWMKPTTADNAEERLLSWTNGVSEVAWVRRWG